MAEDTNITDILSKSVFERVSIILRESEYIYTHDKQRILSDDDIERIKASLMQESSKKKEEAQSYVNFYNALMQFSNLAAESSTNYERHCYALSSFTDMLAQSERTAARIVDDIKSGKLEQKEDLSIMFSLDTFDAVGFIKISNGQSCIEIKDKCNFYQKMQEQSLKTKEALAKYKAWIEAGIELIEGANNKIWRIIPYNFALYTDKPEYSPIFDVYHVFPQYDDTEKSDREYNTAKNLLNMSLEQWNINREQIEAIKKRLKRKVL